MKYCRNFSNWLSDPYYNGYNQYTLQRFNPFFMGKCHKYEIYKIKSKYFHKKLDIKIIFVFSCNVN
jgi:hypothetical protein